MDKFHLDPKVKIVTKTGGAHHFFGYYDKCPWSADGRYLLTLETDLVNRLPTEKDAALIGIVDLTKKEEGSDKKFKPFAKTHAWNFQQGCMLQWLGPDFNERIIFNDFQDNKFVSISLKINGDSSDIQKFEFPIYAVHPSGNQALTLNFSRLNRLREGYGYKGVNDFGVKEEESSNNDGVYLCNLGNNKKDLIISLERLLNNARSQGSYCEGEGENWVDHLTFNSKGDYFAFFHRWKLKNGGFYSQLCVASTNGEIIRVLLNTGMASHFSWLSDREIVAWGRLPESLFSRILLKISKNKLVNRFILPIYRSSLNKTIKQKIIGDSFVYFDIRLVFKKKHKRIGWGFLNEDGHISFSPNRKWLLTDTFDPKNHYRNLVLFNLTTKRKIDLGSFYTLPENITKINWDSSNLRCDLHPRWNHDGTQICIDSVHEGSRQIYVLDVSEVLKEHVKN